MSSKTTPGHPKVAHVSLDTRVMAARVSVKAAAKLGIRPEPRIIKIAETPMREGDSFNADKYLKPTG